MLPYLDNYNYPEFGHGLDFGKANVARPKNIGASALNSIGAQNFFAGAAVRSASKARRKRGRNAVGGGSSVEKMMNQGKAETLQYLESILHPERQLPIGVPDHYSYPFCPMSLVSKYPLTTDASGNLMVLIAPFIANHYTQLVSAAGAWTTQTSQNVSQYAGLTTAIISYRPVSMAASFTCTLPALTAQGEALVGISGSPATVFTASLVANIQQACVEWERCGLNASPGCRAIWFPRDPMDRAYLGTAVLGSQPNNPEGAAGSYQRGSSNLLFSFTGLPASTAFGFIESTLNIEGIPLFGDNFLTKVRSTVNTAEMDLVGNIMSKSSQITSYEAGKAEKLPSENSADSWLSYLERGVNTASTVAGLLSKLY
jgi:hypothetical protein